MLIYKYILYIFYISLMTLDLLLELKIKKTL